MNRLLAFPWRTDVYLAVLGAAIESRTIYYSDLPGGRFHWGKYLARIAAEEQRQGRPPLTSVVVERRTGRPANGFGQAVREVGWVDTDTTEGDVELWRRAIAETHAYWRRG